MNGKFGLSSKAGQKEPVLSGDKVEFVLLDQTERETVYIPIATFVTSEGRFKTITTSQAIRDFTLAKYGEDRYFYSDTDSIHANLSNEDLEELKDIIQIDDYKLGFWAVEVEEFTRAKYLRQKCYIEEIDGKIHVTVAGLPKTLAPLINFDNFTEGFTTNGMTLDDMKKLATANGASKEEIENLRHKLTYTYCKGGVVLTDTDFTIK